MTVESASTFLVATILNGLGFVIICIALVVVNNIFAKYWKPVNLAVWLPKAFSVEPTRFATQDELERITPTLDEKGKNKF
jgi:hypothetical protein